MAIEFEFEVTEGFDFAQAFASRFHQPVVNHSVALPEALGKGYIKEVYLKNDISLCIHRYNLLDKFVLKRIETGAGDMLTVKFIRNGFLSNQEQAEPSQLYKGSHSAEIITNNLFTQVIIPSHTDIDFVVMNLSRATLINLLQLDSKTTSLHHVILQNPSFVFYESMNADMERTMLQIQSIDNAAPLSKLQYETKIYDLLYHLFNKLLTRKETKSVTINQDDAEKIYALKKTILADLSIAPQLPVLARSVGMSETKMKRLFQQVFGQSIYNCFQSARMNEAARLLARFSVSETGIQLGFTNLSHFTRLFEKHHHKKPKRYKDSVSNTSNGNGISHTRENAGPDYYLA